MGKGRHLEYKSSNGYTGSRSINTFKELVKLVEEFPEMRKKLDEVAFQNQRFHLTVHCDVFELADLADHAPNLRIHVP